jgi:phosphatidylinositol-3-phosphatase
MRHRFVVREHFLYPLTFLLFAVTAFAQVPSSNHVVFVLLENHNYSSIVGSPSMTNLNNLISNYGLATQYYANTHPSIGNYFMLTTGQIITNDDSYAQPVTVDNLVRELLAGGKTWRSYAQSLPYDGFLDLACCPYYPYVAYHNPFAYFSDVRNKSTQALNVVQFETHFSSDVFNNQLPNYAFVLPDAQHDGHDCPPGMPKTGCTDEQKMSYVDNWLQTYVFHPLLQSAPFQSGGDGMLVVTFR